MTPQNQPVIHEYFQIKTEKFYYTTPGWIGSELFRELVYNEFYERVGAVRHMIENGERITKGFL